MQTAQGAGTWAAITHRSCCRLGGFHRLAHRRHVRALHANEIAARLAGRIWTACIHPPRGAVRSRPAVRVRARSLRQLKHRCRHLPQRAVQRRAEARGPRALPYGAQCRAAVARQGRTSKGVGSTARLHFRARSRAVPAPRAQGMDQAAKYTEERGNAALAGGARRPGLLGSVKPPRGGRLPPLSETAAEVDEEHLALAREQFDRFDKDNSGTIDKAELRDLFEALHVHMAPSVLEAYVRAAFTTHDVDLSGALECVTPRPAPRSRGTGHCRRLPRPAPATSFRRPRGPAQAQNSAPHPFSLPLSPRFDEFVGVYGAILRENRMRGFSYAEWKKSREGGR